MRQREEGACYAYCKNDSSSFVFPRSEYLRLLGDWMQGKAFFTGTGFYGSTITIKLGDVNCISDCTYEHLKAGREDNDANNAEDALRT